MTNCKFVNIAAKSDIPKDILWDGKLLFIVPNGNCINASYVGNGLGGNTFFFISPAKPTIKILEDRYHNFDYCLFLNQFPSSKILSANTLVSGITTFASPCR